MCTSFVYEVSVTPEADLNPTDILLFLEARSVTLLLQRQSVFVASLKRLVSCSTYTVVCAPLIKLGISEPFVSLEEIIRVSASHNLAFCSPALGLYLMLDEAFPQLTGLSWYVPTQNYEDVEPMVAPGLNVLCGVTPFMVGPSTITQQVLNKSHLFMNTALFVFVM